jgi:hypothetical protein
VNAHPYANVAFSGPRVRRKRSLRSRGGADSVACVAERDEKAVALRIDLSTAVPREHVAEKLPVISQNVGVALAEPAE